MKKLQRSFILSLSIVGFSCSMLAAKGEPNKTATGIPLDTDWKKSIYSFAQKNVVHPAWGINHSERDYQVTKSIAQNEKLDLDEDVLFAAAFLHDVGGIPPYYDKNIDHAIRSVQVIEPLLPQWRFPMEKWPAVKDMILGHTYYGPLPSLAISKAFRDADILDFLGNIGTARILAITQDPIMGKPTLQPMLDTLTDFTQSMPPKCSYSTCRSMAGPRVVEMLAFLKGLSLESINGLVP